MWDIVAGQVAGSLIGAIGGHSAAQKQEDAAKAAGDASRRSTLAQLQLQEPQRYLGYQAQGDLSSLYGYQQSPYTTIGQVTANLSPITSKNLAQMLKRGMSFDEIRSIGTLQSVGPKALKRLTKQGLSVQQIKELQTGYQPPAQPVPNSGTPGATEGQRAAGNMSRFFTSPDYQFRQQEGLSALDRGAAARGGALSGNALRAGTEFSSNLASGEYNNYVQRLMQMAGMGQAATTQAGGAVQSGANAQAGAAIAGGDARASGIMGTTNSVVNGINNGMSLYALSKYMQQPTSPKAAPAGYYPTPGMGITRLGSV
jgi:hypothetical protein